MTNDSIADMLIRIKNGYMARKGTVEVPYSKFKSELVKLLAKHKYVGRVEEAEKQFIVHLNYEQGKPALTQVERISKPGLRRYITTQEMGELKGGLGFLVISTSKGLMTHQEARKARIGGEIICKIW